MKTLNANFSGMKNNKNSAPVILAVFHFNDGDIFISDRTLIAGYDSPLFNGVVTSWGVISSRSNGLFTISLPEITIELTNSGTPAFSSHLENGNAEETEVELFLWFNGLTYAEKEPLGKFSIASPVTYSDDKIRLSLVNSFLRKNRVIGTKISRDNYPDADPDAIGKVERIIYGQVKNVRCLPVVAGSCSTLVSDITDSQTEGIELSLGSDEIIFPASGVVQVGNEKISYASISNRILEGVARGVSGTTPVKHNKGTAIFEPRSDFTYQVAGHPVKNIGDVYVGGVRVASGITKQAGSNGKATVILDSKFTLEKSVALSVSEGSHSHQSEVWIGPGTRTTATRWTATTNPNWTASEHVGKAFKDSAGYYFFIVANASNYVDVMSVEGRTMSSGAYEGKIIRTQLENIYQDTVAASLNAPVSGTSTALCDGSFTDLCNIIAPTGYVDTKRGAAVPDLGCIVGAKLCSMRGNSSYSGTGKSVISGGIFNGLYSQGGGTTAQAYKTNLTRSVAGTVPWSTFEGITIRATFVSGSAAASCSEQWIEVFYIPYGGGASPASGVALSGNSAADIVVEKEVTCDVEGLQDDVYGTYTGTPNSLIQNPADIAKHFMANYMDVPLTEIGPEFLTARSYLAQATGGGYCLAGVIDDSVDTMDFLELISSQSRLKVAHNGYMARLVIFDNAAATVNKIIAKEQIKKASLKVSRTGSEDIINKLEIHYNKDYSREGTERFLALESASVAFPSNGDPTSIASYGQRSPRRPYNFGFVVDQSVAADLRDFYITRLKDRKRRVTFTAFLDVFELEEGDVVALDYANSALDLRDAKFIVEKVSFSPGGMVSAKPDEIHLQVLEI